MNANISEDIHRILKKYWGYDAFRSMQEQIVTSVLNGHDTLALLPTGGGKSICFQVPGLKLGGTTIVISPLISLMNDQVAQLRKRGISAIAISSAMNFREIDVALNNAAYGHVQFLYVSPERLQNQDFREKLSHLPVTLLAVDEAHCISQWGYDFRPSYLKISEVRAYFPGVPVMALTASATGKVCEDIMERLEFRDPQLFKKSFARDNLRYVVQHEENKAARMMKVISNIPGSGVIYLRNRKRTEELAKFLVAQNVSASAYHAGMKYEDRARVQQEWIDNKIRIICATNAFGMGIDKPDVRFVIHLDLPDSLEAYFQEAGRGGRDGNTAWTPVFYSEADRQRLLENHELSFPPLDTIRQTYRAICNYFQIAIGAGEGESYEFDISRICSSYNLSAVQVYNSVRFLEKEGFLSLVDNSFEPSRVMILASKETIYEMEVRSPRYEPLLKTLLRSYGGMFEGYTHISERDLSYRAKSGISVVREQLQYLDSIRLLSYIPQSTLPRLVFVQPRINDAQLTLDPKNYKDLKEQHLFRVRSVLDYTSNNAVCRQLQLLHYFEEDGGAPCGHCDVCIARRNPGNADVKKRLREYLSEEAQELDTLREKMTAYNQKSWVTALNEMVDDGAVETDGKKFRLPEG